MCVLSLLFPPEHTWEGKLSVFSNMACLRRSVWSYSPPGLCWKVAREAVLPGTGGFGARLASLHQGHVRSLCSQQVKVHHSPCPTLPQPDGAWFPAQCPRTHGARSAQGWKGEAKGSKPKNREAVPCPVLTPPSMLAGNLWLTRLFQKCVVCTGPKCSFSHHRYNSSLPLVLGHKISMIWWFSVQFSHSVVSDSFWPQGLQHTSLPCTSPPPGNCSISCPCRWCHPSISSSGNPFSCLQSFPASGSFLRNQFFALGGQSIGISALTSFLPMNIQDFRIYWFDLLAVKGTLKSLLQHHNSPSVLRCSAFFMVQLSHPYMAPRKTIASRRPDKNICKGLSPLLGCQMLNRLRFWLFLVE